MALDPKRAAIAALTFLFSASLILLTALAGRAADPVDPAAKAEAGVRKVIAAYQAAWKKHDLKTLESFWDPDGELLDQDGQRITVRELMKQKAEQQTDGATKANIEIQTGSVRVVTTDVVLVDGTTIVTDTEPALVQRKNFSAVFRKEHGSWLIAHVRELNSPTAAASHSLQDLGWIIGEWIGIGDKTHAQVSSKWSEKGKFIVRTFEVLEAGKIVLSGTHRIGRDPQTKRIKSWFFDSDGTVGEGNWEKVDDHWFVTFSGTLGDGAAITGNTVYTPIDKDSFLQLRTDIRIGGEKAPDRELRMLRQSPDEGKLGAN